MLLLELLFCFFYQCRYATMSLSRCWSFWMGFMPPFSRFLSSLSQQMSRKCWAGFKPLMIILAILTNQDLLFINQRQNIAKNYAHTKQREWQLRKGQWLGQCFSSYNNFSQHCSFLWKFTITYYKNFFLRYVTLLFIQFT